MTDLARERLRAALAANAAQQAELARTHAEVVAASRDSNADDEHDPEGATIAFERQQVVALQEAAVRAQHDIERALAQLEAGGAGGYGTCERCGGPVGADRLEARPTARTCIDCARQRR